MFGWLRKAFTSRSIAMDAPLRRHLAALTAEKLDSKLLKDGALVLSNTAATLTYKTDRKHEADRTVSYEKISAVTGEFGAQTDLLARDYRTLVSVSHAGRRIEDEQPLNNYPDAERMFQLARSHRQAMHA